MGVDNPKNQTMQHIAIMKKSWGLTEKVISGQKKIESRWYKSKYAPWDKIKPEEIVYFKNSSEPVTIKTEVKQVLQFSNLTPERVQEILNKYGDDDGIEKSDTPKFFELFKNKKYCMLIFLKNPQKIAPFEIDKTGFGAMCAWICVDDINKIKKPQKAIFLDWAGTVTDFADVFYKIYKMIAAEIGDKPQSEKQVQHDFTIPYMKFWHLHFPNLTKKRQDELFQKFANQFPLSMPLPNVRKTITALAKSGWIILVASSDPRERLEKEAKQFKIYNKITEIASELHDKIPAIKKLIRKHNIDIENSVYIGDTIGDIETGKKIGLKTVAISTGMNTAKRLKTAKPDYLIDDIKGLLKITKKICLD